MPTTGPFLGAHGMSPAQPPDSHSFSAKQRWSRGNFNSSLSREVVKPSLPWDNFSADSRWSRCSVCCLPHKVASRSIYRRGISHRNRKTVRWHFSSVSLEARTCRSNTCLHDATSSLEYRCPTSLQHCTPSVLRDSAVRWEPVCRPFYLPGWQCFCFAFAFLPRTFGNLLQDMSWFFDSRLQWQFAPVFAWSSLG